MPDEVNRFIVSKASASHQPLECDTPTPTTIYSFRFALWIAAVLISSGLLHLLKLSWDSAEWNGPLSPRKPALFGISGGLTVWSIAWLMTQLRPRRCDRSLADWIALSLLVEVGLITLQYWRGVSSHFNHSTALDTSIEATMLVLILFVTASIFYLTFRTYRLRPMDGSQAVAIRGGMWLLSLSCILGILTTILGQMNLQAGIPYEYWGRAGVLKFPHGAALHAIQVLPILSWLTQGLRVPHRIWLIWSALSSQLLFLLYAVRQTLEGRDRFDFDSYGVFLLVTTCLLGTYPIVMITLAIAQRLCSRMKMK
jgi:hypothetical protein